MANSGSNTTSLGVELKINGQVIPKTDIVNIIVDSELNLPDACRITLKNTQTKYDSTVKVTNTISLKLWQGGMAADTAFVGEIAGVHPNFDSTNGSVGEVEISAFNALHALSRKKNSRTWNGEQKPVDDQQVVSDTLQKYGLTADFGQTPPKIGHTHIYQHNQTDLEHLMFRAARFGYNIVCRDKTVFFQKRTAEVCEPKLMLGANPGSGSGLAMSKFKPRTSTAAQVSKVSVRTWSPDKRKGLICTVTANDPQGAPKLGQDTGNDATDTAHPDTCVTLSNYVFMTPEQGNEIARARLDEHRMSYIQAEGSSTGDARLKPGKVYEISINDPRFDGKYFMVSVRHWYRASGGGSFTTDFHACRDATSGSGGDQSS